MKGIVRKFLSIGCAVATTVSGSMHANAAAKSFVWGDLTLDGIVDASDAQLALQYYVNSLASKPSDPSINWGIGDVDGRPGITAEDAQYILNKYVRGLAHKEYFFPVESSMKYKEEIRALQKWYGWSEKTTSLESATAIIRVGEVFKVEAYTGDDWYYVVLSNDEHVYVHISESDEKYFEYVNDPKDTTPSETTTTTSETTETTTTTTETTSETTTTTQAASESTTTTTTTSESTTTTTATTTSESTTTTTATTSTTEATTTTTTTTQSTPAIVPTVKKECFEVGDAIEFLIFSYVAYDEEFTEPQWYCPTGTIFYIMEKKVLNEGEEVYYCRFLKDGIERTGWIRNAPFGYFRKVSDYR